MRYTRQRYDGQQFPTFGTGSASPADKPLARAVFIQGQLIDIWATCAAAGLGEQVEEKILSELRNG